MKPLILCSALVLAGSLATRAATIDNFESYADNDSLHKAWSAEHGHPQFELATNGLKAVKLTYNAGQPPYLSTIRLAFKQEQDWSSYSTIMFRYRGTGSNPRDDIFLQLKDSYGGVLGSQILKSGTTTNDWAMARIDISAYRNKEGGTSLTNVRSLVIGVKGGDDYGKGTVYFDEITLSR